MKHGILLLVGSFKSGGTETQLVEMLRRIDRGRFEPFVLCLERKGQLLEEVERLDVEIRDANLDTIVSPKAIATMRGHAAWMRERGIAIVHGFHFHGGLYGAVLKKLCPGVRLAMSEQAIYGPEGLKHRIGRRWYYSLTDALTANCEAVRRAVTERDGIEASRITVIYGGVDIERFKPAPRPDPAPGEGRIIGCVGRLHPDKGQIHLLRAASRVLAKHPGTRFLLVGDGPQRAEVEATVASLGLGGHVELLGDRSDVPDLLAAMDVLVLPSASEGFSNAALEGLASGIPVVASDVGGNPEIVLDREVGRLFAPGNDEDLASCLLDVIDDPVRMRKMGSEGRKRAETIFPLEEMIRGHERLYEGMLAEGRANMPDSGVRAVS